MQNHIQKWNAKEAAEPWEELKNEIWDTWLPM